MIPIPPIHYNFSIARMPHSYIHCLFMKSLWQVLRQSSSLGALPSSCLWPRRRMEGLLNRVHGEQNGMLGRQGAHTKWPSQTLKETGLSLRRKWDTPKRGRASADDCSGPAGAQLTHPFLRLSVLLLAVLVSWSLGFTEEAGREINSLS